MMCLNCLETIPIFGQIIDKRALKNIIIFIIFVIWEFYAKISQKHKKKLFYINMH